MVDPQGDDPCSAKYQLAVIPLYDGPVKVRFGKWCA